MNRAQCVDAVVRVDALMVDRQKHPVDLPARIAGVNEAALADRLYDRLRARGVTAADARDQAVALAADLAVMVAPEQTAAPQVAPGPAPRNACTCDHVERVHKINAKGARTKCSAYGCPCTTFAAARPADERED